MYLKPLTEQETLMLGDWVMERVRKDNPDPRYWSPLHLNLENQSPSEARRTLRSVGYQIRRNELMYAIGRMR